MLGGHSLCFEGEKSSYFPYYQGFCGVVKKNALGKVEALPSAGGGTPCCFFDDFNPSPVQVHESGGGISHRAQSSHCYPPFRVLEMTDVSPMELL